jgi:magnesium transporter
MFTAFLRYPDGNVRRFDSLETTIPALEETESAWIDIERPKEAEMKKLGNLYSLDPDALEDCLVGEQPPRVDEYENCIFVIFYGLAGFTKGSDLVFNKLTAFFSHRFLITVHDEPLRTVTGLRERCKTHGNQMFARGMDFLLYTLIDGMVDRYDEVVDTYEDVVEDLEEASLLPAREETILAGITRLRRELLELRRVASSQKELLLPLVRGEYNYIGEHLEQRFSHVYDHMARAVGLMDRMREQLHGVLDNYHSTLTARTNDVMKILAVFAAILMPVSIIAGIYGMNVPLPFMGHPASFWIIMGGMASMAAALLGFFRWRRWI